MKRLLIPVRLNFLGGWSDQPQWPHPACVVNAAVGWQHGEPFSPYPLMRDESGFMSAVEGVGTGLGISSIRAAADWLYDHADPFSPSNEYVFRALEWERQNGTLGGWQDQIGAVEPGMKCITTSDHEDFCISYLDHADLFAHLVLFDTGIRRPAKAIGDKVRSLLMEKRFAACLKANVDDARHARQYDTERFAKTALEGWRRLTEQVPEMAVTVPDLPGTWGTMLMGAGGGGFGVAFLIDTDCRRSVEARLREAGMTAYRPMILPGLKVEDE